MYLQIGIESHSDNCTKKRRKQCLFSKEETDQEAVDIRQKCEDHVLNVNNLQSEILVIKTPIRRVCQ